MYRIPSSQIKLGECANGPKIPRRVRINCPFCHEEDNFLLQIHPMNEEGVRRFLSPCSWCEEKSLFVWIMWPIDNLRYCPDTSELYIHPSPRMRAPKIELNADILPEHVLKEYLTCVKMFNQGEWIAALLHCRRTLEVTTKSFLPDIQKGTPLSDHIEALAQSDNFSRVLNILGHEGQLPGTQGPHYSEDGDPDSDMVKMSLEGIEHLLHLLFVLPELAKSFGADKAEPASISQENCK